MPIKMLHNSNKIVKKKIKLTLQNKKTNKQIKQTLITQITNQLIISKALSKQLQNFKTSNYKQQTPNLKTPMPTSKQLLAVLKGLRNGLEYGSKVRFVHSLVITMLFKKLNRKELVNIFKLALEHGKNLGLFVFAYKLSTLVMEKLLGKNSANNFVSGFIFGGLIFGKQTPVNHQIVLYLLSRVLTALVTLLYKRHFHQRWQQTEPTPERKVAFPLLAALCWGLVMWLFTIDKSVLQSSLTSSMQFLYVESNQKLKTLLELIPYFPKPKKP